MPASVTEIPQPLVAAFRVSEAFPNIENAGVGRIHLLFDGENCPVGYLVHKFSLGDSWENPDPRYFVTRSHAEALQLLTTPWEELSAFEPAEAS
jgi:hypothetical protein